MKCKKIYIVAGHETSGAVASDGTTEREIVQDVAKRLFNILVKKNINVLGIGINRGLSLYQKIKLIKADCKKNKLTRANSLLLSIHADWRKAKQGTGGYFMRKSYNSKNFLEKCTHWVALAWGKTPRSINYLKPDTASRFNRLGIIADTKPLACLVEIGTLAGNDLKNMKKTSGREKLAIALYRALVDYGEPEEQKSDIEEIKENNSRCYMELEEENKQLYGMIETNKKIQRQFTTNNDFLRSL